MKIFRSICVILFLLISPIIYGQQYRTTREAYVEWKNVYFPTSGWDEDGYVYLAAIVNRLGDGRARVNVGAAVPSGNFSLVIQPIIVRGIPHVREKRTRWRPSGAAKILKIGADNSGAARPNASFYDYSLEMEVAPKVNALRISITRGKQVVVEPAIIDLTEGGAFLQKVSGLKCPC